MPQASYEDGLTIFYLFTHDDVRELVCIKARDDAWLNTVQAHKRAAYNTAFVPPPGRQVNRTE